MPLKKRELPVLIKVSNLKSKQNKKVTLMFHTNNPIIKHKASLLNLAEERGNVSKACKVMGVSRDTFYRYQELVESACSGLGSSRVRIEIGDL
jgi:ACT domain-containing protein